MLAATDLIRATGDVGHLRLLQQTLRAANVRQGWLVGGALRDLACGTARSPLDLDLAVPGDGRDVARLVEQTLGGKAFPLDEGEGAWRVALHAGGTVDVVPLREPCIEDDLRGRDFTVNAMALDLLGRQGLLDPLGGLADLHARRLRLCAPDALVRDPLRILRAYRLAAQLGFELDSALSQRLAEAAHRLPGVAAERTRSELFLALGLPGAPWTLRTMVEHGVMASLFPFTAHWARFDQGDYHAHDLLEHALQTAEAASRLAEQPQGLPSPARMVRHLGEVLEAGITRRSLLILCAFLHDVGKPDTASLDGLRRRFLGHETLGGRIVRQQLRGLRTGRRTAEAAARIVAAHLRLFQLTQQEAPTARARLRYLKDLGSEVPEAVLLSLADETATGPRPRWLALERKTAVDVLELFWQRREARDVAPLLRGRDLVDLLGVKPGPEVGQILRAVEDAERRGTVSNREEALAFARAARRPGARGSPP